MALGIFTTDPDEVSKSMFDQEQRLARLRDEQFRQRRKLLAGRLRESGNLELGLSTGNNTGTGEDLSRFNVGVRETRLPSQFDSNRMMDINRIPDQPRKIPDNLAGVVGVGGNFNINDLYRKSEDIINIPRNPPISSNTAIGGYNPDLDKYYKDGKVRPEYEDLVDEKATEFIYKEKEDLINNPALINLGEENSFIGNAIKAFNSGKANNVFSTYTLNMAANLKIAPGDALALLSLESNFGNDPNWKKPNRAAKGPLQIEKIAFDDIRRYYLETSKPAFLPDAEWNKYKAMVESLSWSDVSNDPQKAITAGLLYFKQIQLLGVPRQFWGAAYNDGLYKFIDKTDFDQVPLNQFATNNKAARKKHVRKYMNAFNVISPITANLLSGNPDQIAGLNVSSATTTDAPSGGSQNNQNVVTTRQSGQKATGDFSSLEGSLATGEEPKQKPGVDTGGGGPTNDDRTNFYLSNPTRLGRDINNAISGRTLIKEQAERDINMLYSDLLAAELSGKMGLYSDLLTRIRAIQTNAETQIFNQDMAIQQLNGTQALSDLFVGSPQRASFILSETKGVPHLVVPRNDGKFDIEVDGKLFKTMNFRDISDYIRSSFDEQYRITKSTSAAELSKLSLEQFYALQRIDKEGSNKLEEIVAQMKAKITEFGSEYKVMENYMGQNIPALVSKDGRKVIVPQLNEDLEIVNYYTINPQIIPANAYETD